MTETALYRHFDGSDRLLYVGISLSPTYRLSQHNANASWAKAIRRITIEVFPTREAALLAERFAIQRENPQHNIQHKPANNISAAPVTRPAEPGKLYNLYYFLLRVTEEFLENPSSSDEFVEFYDGAVEEALATRTELTCGFGSDWQDKRATDLATASQRPEISLYIPELTEFRLIGQGLRPWPPRGYASNQAIRNLS